VLSRPGIRVKAVVEQDVKVACVSLEAGAWGIPLLLASFPNSPVWYGLLGPGIKLVMLCVTRVSLLFFACTGEVWRVFTHMGKHFEICKLKKVEPPSQNLA